MGVWIETWKRKLTGLVIKVTPCMGVWIETYNTRPLLAPSHVTPCMGVWIETYCSFIVFFAITSHPVWVCGLKQACKKNGTHGK